MSGYAITVVNVLLLNVVHVLSNKFDCKQCDNIDYSNPDLRPQDCARYCKSVSLFHSNEDEIDSEEVEYLMDQVTKISVMVTALIILVTLVIMLLLYFIIKNSRLSNVILLSWKSCWQRFGSKKETKETKSSLDQVTVHKDQNATHLATKSEKPKVVFLNTKSSRKPTESISPDDSEGMEVDGYDNLGMSRSTINTASRCSSPSSPVSNNGMTSCATIDTTMTTINLDS